MKKAFLAEFLGTFFLIFISGCAVIMNSVGLKIDYVCTVLTVGLTLGLCYFLFSGISGAHFNPAITFGYFITARMSFKKFVFYSLGQLFGGVLAGIMLRVIFAAKCSYLIPKVYSEIPKYDDLTAVVIIVIFEFIFSFLLMCVYLSVNKRKNRVICALVVGFSYFVMNAILYAVDGCGLNVIRILIPAFFEWKWNNVLFYIISVFIGCMTGGICYTLLFPVNSEKEG